MIKDCPKKKSLNAMMLEDKGEEARVSSMDRLSSLEKCDREAHREKKTNEGELMFVEAEVNGSHTKAL
ncbi:hypothetical protein, partial [Mycobacterium tuberculosis]